MAAPAGGALAAPRCRVGVLADPQYWAYGPEDVTEQPQWTGSTRRYREVLRHVRQAVESFRGGGGAAAVDLVVQLGDIIDGANVGTGTSAAALETILAELGDGPWGQERLHHVVGNNDIRNFSRAELATWMPRSRPGEVPELNGSEYHHYYDFAPCPGWRFVILDTYVWSIVGQGCREAKELLAAGNPNCAGLTGDSPTEAFLQAAGGFHTDEQRKVFLKPDSLERRLLAWNAGVGPEQLEWLKRVLADADKAGESVIVFGHNPVLPATLVGLDGLALDFQQVLDALNGSGSVVAYLSGHEHTGGYARDRASGVHHLVVPSPLDAELGTGSRYAVLELHDGFFRLRGEGGVPVEPGLQRFCKACRGSGLALHTGQKCFPCDGSGAGPGGFDPEQATMQPQASLFFGDLRGLFFSRSSAACTGP